MLSRKGHPKRQAAGIAPSTSPAPSNQDSGEWRLMHMKEGSLLRPWESEHPVHGLKSSPCPEQADHLIRLW